MRDRFQDSETAAHERFIEERNSTVADKSEANEVNFVRTVELRLREHSGSARSAESGYGSIRKVLDKYGYSKLSCG